MLHVELRSARSAARSPDMRLAEAMGLARAIELEIVHAEMVRPQAFRPGTLVGRGTVERLAGLIKALEVGVVVVDGVLSPVQQRNLERAWTCKVIDRTGLILEIFGSRARTAEGRLQVELASLTYQKSRLVRTWTHLERQRGGFGFLGGPGEAQLESDRRILGERIVRLQRELEDVKRTRALHRRARARVPYPVVALVGYTNAGKSTLFNRLVRAHVIAADMPFATLDPSMRALALPSGRKVILSDTVGLISDLPTDLVAAFRATLEEVRAADLIIHVRDISHPETEAQRGDVHAVLRELDLGAAVDADEIIEALNKVDLVSPEWRAMLTGARGRAAPMVAVSALTGEGCEELLAAIDARLAARREVVDLVVGLGDGASLAWLYSHGEVIAREVDGEFARVKVRLDPADRARFAHRQGARHGASADVQHRP